MKTFRDIFAWQKGYELTLLIYKTTKGFPKSEEFGLKSQLRRATISIISNIAEGFKRLGNKDKIRFYNMAEASLEEVKCQTMLSRDLGLIDHDTHKKICRIEDETGKMLQGWIKAQQRNA